ncbi:hypothetical protein [Streptomyces sp. MZ04]|uniref:hypothetical protein n=1 Tax=Streptomyces sp. MZ04 TaxID=2559236 RepID=UPI00107E9593|nr:hypothetical protein [Streptomyces sp. MZ04]TGB03201.1 hypothetical protein E2651_25840 [Streptomyces sp. MZ04]
MKSTIECIDRWDIQQPQRDDTLCSAHGKKWCSRDLAADVWLSNAGSPRIHWTVCAHWLDNEPDVAEHDRRQGI